MRLNIAYYAYVLLQYVLFRYDISELPRPIAMTLRHVIGILVKFIIAKVRGSSPPKNGGQRHAQFWPILHNFRI